jgi:hypothetical protein
MFKSTTSLFVENGFRLGHSRLRKGGAMHRLVSLVGLIATVLVVAAPASADPGKTRCPAGSGWTLWNVGAAASEIYPNLLPGLYPWADAGELAAFIDASYNKNGDDTICVKTTWGDNLNPKSHWYLVGMDLVGEPTTQYSLHDNNANASDT